MEQNYTNISALLIGISTAFFSIFALHILLWRKERTRFQTVLGWIMTIWAVWNLKDIVMTFRGMYTQEVLNWIMLIDGWSTLTYTVFISEVVQPGWMTWRKLGLQAIPFALFTLLYIMTPEQWIIYAYAVFLWCYAWAIVIIGIVKTRHYLSYVRKNFSNIDDIDVSWLNPVFFFAIISQLSWLVVSLHASVVSDIVYYVSTILLWLMVLHYSWNFRPVKVEKETELSADIMLKKNPPPHFRRRIGTCCRRGETLSQARPHAGRHRLGTEDQPHLREQLSEPCAPADFLRLHQSGEDRESQCSPAQRTSRVHLGLYCRPKWFCLYFYFPSGLSETDGDDAAAIYSNRYP